MIITDLQLFSIVDDKSFLKLILELEPLIQISDQEKHLVNHSHQKDTKLLKGYYTNYQKIQNT